MGGVLVLVYVQVYQVALELIWLSAMTMGKCILRVACRWRVAFWYAVRLCTQYKEWRFRVC